MKFHKSSEKFPKNIQSLIIKVAKITNLPKYYWKIHNYPKARTKLLQRMI